MEILSLKNAIRIVEFKIFINNENKSNLNNIFKLRNFFENYRHPDLPLSIILEIDDDVAIEYDWFYNLTSVLSQIESNFIVKSNLKKIDEKSLQLLSKFYSIILKKDSSFKEVDDNLIYLSSRNISLVVELQVDDSCVSLIKDFKDFYDILSIKSSFNINYFTSFRDKHNFVDELLNQIDLIIKDTMSIKYIPELNRESYWPDFAKSLIMNYDGFIVDSKYSVFTNLVKDSIINGNDFKKILLKKDLNKCNNCVALNRCGGGFYSIFENTSNSDVFCAINMGLVLLYDKLLSGGYNEKNDNRM